uniref:RNA-binding protein 48 n=1 Tax=Erigeron canadensis TaxID=72917 RepID=UPI001CB8BAF2|nr:RNA-binding protein 48 [Erigeron canadensis]
MPRNKDEAPAVRVYTVCDESKYLIVRNVPALGCGDELNKLFAGFGEIDQFIPLDDEDCEPFTDVYWIKFRQVNNARFAKRKLDDSVFIGNKLQVSYAPQYESLNDTKEKLEGRRKEVLARLNPGRSKGPNVSTAVSSSHSVSCATSSQPNFISEPSNFQQREQRELQPGRTFPSTVSSNQDYFPVESMNQTVRLVRETLNKIESDTETLKAASSKRPRTDNRRRI